MASLMVRGQVGTLLGIPLAACTLVTDVVLLIWRYAGGIPPLRRELPGYGLVALLSVAVMWIALRAWQRTRRAPGASRSPRIARMVPWLIAAGVAGGLFAGNAWGYDLVDLDRRVVTDMCAEALPAGPHGDPAPAALAVCVEIADSCRVAPDSESRGELPGEARSRGAWLACIKRQLLPEPRL